MVQRIIRMIKPRRRITKDSTLPTVSEEQFAELTQQRAFELYSRRGTDQGDALADWLEAEQQVRVEVEVG